MPPREVSAEEAQDLLFRSRVAAAEAAVTTVAPRIIAEIGGARYVVAHLTSDASPAVADLFAAAPDLLATVVSLHKRLRPWQDAAADATTLRARAEEDRDAALRQCEELTRERDALRAIIEGRTTPPTREEADTLDAQGGVWRVTTDSNSGGWCYGWTDVHAFIRSAEANGEALRWWAHDKNEAPCAWPVATEAPDGR
jgi:hypothetical protein